MSLISQPYMLQQKPGMTRAALVLVLFVLMLPTSSSSSNFTDQQSLLAFKSKIIDHNGLLTNNWTESANFCSWVGISCSKRRPRVTHLRLPDLGLGGTISPHIGNLSFLKVLDLSNNSFHGNIVHEISNLRRLEMLILRHNSFEGIIPPSLKHCQHLQTINILSNKVAGSIPEELSTLPRLRFLHLGKNNLTGTIPASLANVSTLEALTLEKNGLHGNFPHQLAYLPKLTKISAGANYLTGSLPPQLFNISSMEAIAFGTCGLTGELPSDDGFLLPNLRILELGDNQFTGKIPSHLSNSSMLTILDLGLNQLSGTVPASLGNLELLTVLSLQDNFLNLEPNTHQLSFITSFTRLRSLQYLTLGDNQFNGSLPYSIGNFSGSLQMILAPNCQINGNIPATIAALKSLNFLDLGRNSLSGSVPSTIQGMRALQRLYLNDNRLEGSIPSEICRLSNLGELSLENNQFSGPIPDCIGGNLSFLQSLFLGSNKLNSTIPPSLWRLENLISLNLSFNSLDGSISPNSGGLLRSMGGIDLSWNQLLGSIPESFGSFQSLSYLNLSHNSFQGPIPQSLGKLIALDVLDLSYNNLSNSIPKSLESIRNLKLLNLSHNKLSGEVPKGGPFANLTSESFLDNEELCGVIVAKPCKDLETRKSESKLRLLAYILPPVLAAVLAFGVLLYMLKRRGRRNVKSFGPENILQGFEPKLFSYQQLCRATNNFSEANLLGMGSFGSVYKGTLGDGEVVALKLLNLQVEGAIKSFDAECKVLRTVRHRNLVRIISTCTNEELRALVLEYMSNGSLHMWLYSHDHCLSLLQRVSIMLDVALAVEYLHQGLEEAVVHRDLKPSNVMLDEDMVAHVGDFGIAKILAEHSTSVQTNTLGTIGYIPPEYGVDGRVSTKGDIYSFGILVLETFTRRRPTDEMFVGELNLRKWVGASVPDRIEEVVDQNLLIIPDKKVCMDSLGMYLVAILNLAMECCEEDPEKRSDIKDVVNKLNKIKLHILSEVQC